MSQSWWSSNQSDPDKWDSWPKKIGWDYFKEENANLELNALNLEKSSALTQNGKQLTRQKFCWKRCWGCCDSHVGYVSTVSYYYSKRKHEALLLRAACLVLGSELQQMWRQLKRKENDQSIRKHAQWGKKERARALIYWMNDWRDVRSFQIITGCPLFSVSIVDIKRKECAKITSRKSYIRY